MKIIEDITENEMILALLRAKMNSHRFVEEMQKILKDHNANRDIIDHANLEDKEENAMRKVVFESFGGSESGGTLFQNCPSDVDWKRVLLDKNDLQRVKYIDYSYWNELSGGSRFVADGAANVQKGLEVYGQSNQQYWDALDALKNGQKFPQPILIAEDLDADLVVIDGHLRLTTYFLDPEYMPDEIEAILGLSKKMKDWDLY